MPQHKHKPCPVLTLPFVMSFMGPQFIWEAWEHYLLQVMSLAGLYLLHSVSICVFWCSLCHSGSSGVLSESSVLFTPICILGREPSVFNLRWSARIWLNHFIMCWWEDHQTLHQLIHFSFHHHHHHYLLHFSMSLFQYQYPLICYLISAPILCKCHWVIIIFLCPHLEEHQTVNNQSLNAKIWDCIFFVVDLIWSHQSEIKGVGYRIWGWLIELWV